MQNVKPRTESLAILLLVLVALPAGAAERTLLTLESQPQHTIELNVMDAPGAQRADPIAAFSTWKLKPGDPIRSDQRPPDRVVELYSGTKLAPSLLCRVVLHYYATEAGWMPRFRLDDEPAVAWVHGRWRPLGGFSGIVEHGNLLPNAEGFLQTIEFGLGSGPLTIVGWRVR